MGTAPEPSDLNDWQPATSQPGELFTPTGDIRSAGNFARNASNHDPRLRDYRRSMRTTGLWIAAVGLLAAVVVVLAASIL